MVAEDNSKPCIKLLKSDVPIHFIYQGNAFNSSNRINAIEELDWWDRDYLKQSYINTFYYSSRSVTVDHPFILSKCKITFFSQQIVINNLKFIYCVSYNFSTLVRGQTFINQLVEALEPNDTTKTYTITLRNEDYLLLTQEQIEHITVTCNYTLVNKIV